MVVGVEASFGSRPSCSRDCLLLVTLLFTVSLGTRDQDALNCEKNQKGSGSIVQRWRAPPVGSFKVNVDAK
ncbi:hypothetical protein LWI29_020719 [Acer saccharum]|uniref:Secreted protein n=1 Tax=Acer saccharum TaxID=4024 RepID=A0AA39RME1_ACESA|nr:hypothetical protein LWI29_020719 [Acer saccharum]